MITRYPTRLTLACLALLCGCDSAVDSGGTGTGSSQPGDHSDGTDAPGAVTVPYCKDRVEFLSGLDAPLGTINLNEIVNGVSGSYAGTWSTQVDQGGPAKANFSPNLEGIEGTVGLSYEQGQIRLVHRDYVPCTPGAPCADLAVTCIDAIEVDMKLALNSVGGALAENWLGTLTLLDPRDPDFRPEEHETGAVPGSYRVHAEVDPVVFQGSASLQLVVDPKWSLTKHRLKVAVEVKDKVLQSTVVTNFVELKEKREGPDSAMAAGNVPILRLNPKAG